MRRLTDPRILYITSMVVFGTIGLFVRNITVPSGELAMYRAVLASVMLSGYLAASRQKIPFRKIGRELPLLLISGVAMGFNWILLFEAYKYTTISVATISYYFAPVIVTLVSPVLFKEKTGAKQWICFFMSTLGIILIIKPGGLSEGGKNLIGILFGLGAACLYACVILLNKLIRQVEGIHRTFLQFLAAVIVLFPYVALTGGFTVSSLDRKGLILLLIVGFIHTGVAYCLYFSSLKELPGQKAAILSYIDPLVAVFASVLLLGERMTLLQVAGGCLILGFTLWNEIGS